MRFLSKLFIIISLLYAGSLTAQNVDEQLWRDLIEEWAELNDSETVPDELFEEFQNFIDNPINLNDTSSELLASLPFISDINRDIIKAYIAQNGQMVTTAELRLMNGFDSLQIKLMEIFCTATPIEENEFPSLKEILRHGHSNLLMGVKTQLPLSRAYVEEKYQASPFREYFRYRFHYSNHISLMLSGEKDAGESFRFATSEGNNRAAVGFDYYGYHLMVNDLGFVKSAIVGKYQLQFGQGATLWSGFAPWGGYDMPLRRYGQGIRAASAFCEYGYLRGAAATLSLIPKRLEATLFYSFVNRDATTSSADSSNSNEISFSSIYNSGYHRTENEIMKKWQLSEHLAGTHIQYRHSSLTIGTTAFGTFFSNEIQPTEYIYNSFAFKGKKLFNAGIDASWRYHRTLFFGEMATSIEQASYMPDDSPFPLAAVAGLQTDFNSDNALSVAYRYGSVTYHNYFANTIGQGSSPQNQSELIINFKTRLPMHMRLSASADLFRYPWMRYRIYAPSSGADFRIRLSKSLSSTTEVVIQYQHKTVDRNSDLETYAIEPTTRQRLSLHIDYNSNGWHLLSRVIFTHFDCLDHDSEHGFLMMQDVGRTFKVFDNNMTISTRAAIFDISSYDARIYTSESDLMYEFNSPMLMYRGMRGYLVVRYDLSKGLSLALKYSVSYYPEQETLGSGYDTTEGGIRNEFKAQLRLRF